MHPGLTFLTPDGVACSLIRPSLHHNPLNTARQRFTLCPTQFSQSNRREKVATLALSIPCAFDFGFLSLCSSRHRHPFALKRMSLSPMS
jgi:hypothetical protein